MMCNASEGLKKFRKRLGKNISKVLQLRIIGKGKGKETPYAGYIIEAFDPFCFDLKDVLPCLPAGRCKTFSTFPPNLIAFGYFFTPSQLRAREAGSRPPIIWQG
jgi:hypothetical protein